MSGIGCTGNRHLNYLVESIFVNVGGSCQDATVSSPRMPNKSGGGVIVVRAWESPVQGEGRQGVNVSLVESKGKSDEVQTFHLYPDTPNGLAANRPLPGKW